MLNPQNLKIASLMTGRLFRIPEYQRAYSWTSRQREDLFNDIREAFRTDLEHFMATVVALYREARVIGADEFRVVELVDGQQRITTLVILLKSIWKAFDPDLPKQAKMKRDIGDLLVKDDEQSLILLQTNHASSNVFANYILQGVITEDEVETAADQNLIDAMHECEAFTETWRDQDKLIDLLHTIRNKLSLIFHEVADEATVYRVFEVLNSRGLDVKWIDKLKSQLMALLFEHVNSSSRPEHVMEMLTLWQRIYRTLGIRSDLGDEALRFAGALVHDVAKNRIPSQEDSSNLLAKYAGTELKTIMKAGKHLVDVVRAVEKLHSDVRKRAVTRILQPRFAAVAILLRKFPKAQEANLLSQWERLTFRIYSLGMADARSKIGGKYSRLGFDIVKGMIDPEEISTRLKALGAGYEIDIVLNEMDWSDCYNNWQEDLRYLLYRYDEHLSEAAGTKLNQTAWNKVWKSDAAKSIEHIAPQKSALSYVHDLGNLTMLPPNVNSSLKDSLPADKSSQYIASGTMATAEIGRSIEAGLEWNETAVIERRKRLEAFIRTEWAD